jgi:hypothetical protein
MKIDYTNWKEHISEMERVDNVGKCWNCDGSISGYYLYEYSMFYECEHCKGEICLNFSSLMPMFGVALEDEWKAEEKASQNNKT